jgi:hypothetical protein
MGIQTGMSPAHKIIWLIKQEFRHLGRFREKFPDVPISVSSPLLPLADIRHSQLPQDQKPGNISAES